MPRRKMAVVQTGLRIPQQLWERLALSAAQSGASLNAEILSRINASYDLPDIEATIHKAVTSALAAHVPSNPLVDAFSDAMETFKAT
jgi:hypothetical protein